MRFGTIDQANTYGTGIPEPNFTVNTANNRLSGQSGTMSYDAAGNLTTDTYSAAAVTRVYDAENRMTKETQANSYVAGIYSYDGDGRRVKRIVDGTETWQVYGLAGELLAEYAQNGAPPSPQKEYGYRNGQLLITAEPGGGWGNPPALHDNPLVVAETTVQSRHVTELRDAINALRSHMSMSAYPWTTSATTSDWITAGPILEMRTALDQALGAPSPSYASGLAQGQPVKAIHIQELRDRVLAAWSNGSSTQINWLVTDQLGTPRMIFDQSGSLATVSRHDYLPFGEELFAGIGGRTQAQGYSLGDGARQHFTSYERDSESGLDYAHARYYSSAQGRFTGADIPLMDQYKTNPQSWNLYTYVGNKPLTYTDPFGLWKQVDCSTGKCWEAEKGDTFSSLAKIMNVSAKQLSGFFQNEQIAIGHVFDVSGFGASNTPAAQAQRTYLEVMIWYPSSAHLASMGGHVSYNINGQSWSWERGGWAKPRPIEDYLKDNTYRNGVGYVLDDENDPQFAAEMAEQIKSFHGDGNSVIPGFGPYGLIKDNCGEAFCRAAKNMGLPRNDGVLPTDHASYIMNKLRPYIKSVNFYRHGAVESRPVRR